MATESAEWFEENHRYLMTAIAQIKSLLDTKAEDRTQTVALPSIPWGNPSHSPALETLCQQFGLSSFERHILLLGVGIEINDGFAQRCSELQGNDQKRYPTFGLAMHLFPSPHWNALTPDAPLRYWKLVELGPASALTASPLRIDERILHYLLGIQLLDIRLEGIAVADASTPIDLPSSHQQLAEQIADISLQPSDNQAAKLNPPGGQPIIQLCGGDGATKQAIAQAACQLAQLNLITVTPESFPTELSQFNLVQTLCDREARLHSSALLLNCDSIPETTEGDGGMAQLNCLVSRFIDCCPVPLLVMSRSRRRQRDRPFLTFDIPLPTPAEQRHLWQRHLGEAAAQLNGQIDQFVSNFNLSPLEIRTVCNKVIPLTDSPSEIRSSSNLSSELWKTCLAQARPRLDELAQVIKAGSSWHDLVLPEKEMQVLKTLAAHVRQRAKVYEQWGFGDKSGRGLGISALFAGSSGTGKTLAAEVLANALNLDLYRIDLSTVVSKYIGETEKNLRRIFDAAETGGAILLFDEADALFGKRSEVKDSHDRYANMEVAYLLQRIESYRGLAILTTNLKGSVDQAFLRRIRFIVQFPFPDAAQREEIWRRVFPTSAPLQDLAYRKLSKLSVAGGNIRNIALNAAFLAADGDESVGMQHLLQAAQAEYMKLERPLTDSEVRGWVKS